MISIPEKSGGRPRLFFHDEAKPGSCPLGVRTKTSFSVDFGDRDSEAGAGLLLAIEVNILASYRF